MGRGIFMLAGGLMLAVAGGTVAGNATVSGMASRSDYGLPSDGTEIAAAATQSTPAAWSEESARCADCTDRTGMIVVAMPAAPHEDRDDDLSDW